MRAYTHVARMHYYGLVGASATNGWKMFAKQWEDHYEYAVRGLLW